MRKFHFETFVLVVCLLLASFVFVVAQKDPLAELVYPIAELGNCSDKNACALYCEEVGNRQACLDFAQIHGLLSQEEIESARRVMVLGEGGGPGGCQGQEECEAYCDQIDNIKECIEFAERNNLISADELDEARKVIRAIDRGLIPPKCKGKQECEVYCSRPENMEECLVFVKEAGIMPPEELKEAEKMLAALKKGARPPACAGKKQCDVYCSQAEHMEECLEFGIAAGFIPAEEVQGARGMLKALKQGIKPPNCQGRQECDVFCSQREHMEECMTFSLAAGFIAPEEVENVKKTLQAIRQGVMPPNCRGEEECNIYCSQKEHRQECMDFAVAAGFMTQEEAERAKKGSQAGPGGCQTEQECQEFCSKPENSETCINFALERGEITPEEAERMRQPLIPQGPEPGGCQTPEQCGQLPQEQGEFIPPGEQQPGPEVFPEQMPLPEQVMPPAPEAGPLMPVSPEELPQSILNIINYFLASISAVFQK